MKPLTRWQKNTLTTVIQSVSYTHLDAGMSYCESQIIELLANDVEGIHLYTMNNVRVAKRLTEGIKNLI